MYKLVIAVLLASWILGWVTSHTLGGLIHLLPVIALITLLLRIHRGPAEVMHKRGDGTQGSFKKP